MIIMMVFSCRGQGKEVTKVLADTEYTSFGAKIDLENVQNDNQIRETYKMLTPTDTIAVKFIARVEEVCKVKGCWMKLKLSNDEEVMVRFKDYGFFVPTDIKGKQVAVNGMAFINEMSVNVQKHYAQDEGKSDEEIARITLPKRIYGFDADGVLLKN
ncbi:DUF4920 domain-containing protein [Maribacter sp. 2304DJ31-5]